MAIALLVLLARGAAASAAGDGSAGLSGRVADAFASGSASALASLFPADRKVAVSFDRIADLQGYVGSGPLVEALRRYLGSHSDARFEPAAATGGAGTRVKGTLVSRGASGRRERVGLVFTFEKIDDAWLAVEVRETG